MNSNSVVDATIREIILTPFGILAVRDSTPSDVEYYVNYWNNGSDQYLEFLGVSRNVLGTVDDIRNRFLEMVYTPDKYQHSVAFTITLNNKVIGYTNLNRYASDENFPHLHTYRSLLKSAIIHSNDQFSRKRFNGLAALIIGPIINNYFSLFPIERITLQTRTRNTRINRALDLYFPTSEEKYFEKPDGLAGSGLFFMRYVNRSDIPIVIGNSLIG